jgi:hypothetical protein
MWDGRLRGESRVVWCCCLPKSTFTCKFTSTLLAMTLLFCSPAPTYSVRPVPYFCTCLRRSMILTCKINESRQQLSVIRICRPRTIQTKLIGCSRDVCARPCTFTFPPKTHHRRPFSQALSISSPAPHLARPRRPLRRRRASVHWRPRARSQPRHVRLLYPHRR